MSRLLNYSPDRYSRISETRQSVLISSGPIGPKWHLYQKTSQLWHVCGTNPEFEDIDEGTKVPIYQRLYQERATGIEPALPAWEAGVLPLNYARALFHYIKKNPTNLLPDLWEGYILLESCLLTCQSQENSTNGQHKRKRKPLNRRREHN